MDGAYLGSVDIAQRANTLWKKIVADYEAPPLDPAIDEALADYADRRRRKLLPSAS